MNHLFFVNLHFMLCYDRTLSRHDRYTELFNCANRSNTNIFADVDFNFLFTLLYKHFIMMHGNLPSFTFQYRLEVIQLFQVEFSSSAVPQIYHLLHMQLSLPSS